LYFFLKIAGIYFWIVGVVYAVDMWLIFIAVVGTVILKGLLLGIVTEGSATRIMKQGGSCYRNIHRLDIFVFGLKQNS
jgi:ABC-type protease/lipase transport system fused ATPase/permease subunit